MASKSSASETQALGNLSQLDWRIRRHLTLLLTVYELIY